MQKKTWLDKSNEADGSQLDMFDSNGAFAVQVPVLAHRCPALLYALLALSARQIERKEQTQRAFDSIELYQQSIRLLSHLLQAKDFTLIPTCVILCCLEMMSASPRDWRRHLEGCAALFDAFGVNGFSGGILQSTFWCYARMGEHWQRDGRWWRRINQPYRLMRRPHL
jgi:hypothetical protein